MLQCVIVSTFAPLAQTTLTGSAILPRRNRIFPQKAQNEDFPPILPKKKKKPYPKPFKQIKESARAKKELAKKGIETPLSPLLVEDLVPTAHQLLHNWKALIKGVAQLLHVVPVHACRDCSRVHVAESGHEIQDCRGSTSFERRGRHAWVKGSIDDVLVPVESYHMYDPFGSRITHETRFDFDRAPALVELCIQAGVNIPEYPSRRRKGIDVDERALDFDTDGATSRFGIPEDVPGVARETVEAFEGVKRGVRELMAVYSVKACGYCSEIHVGPWGHNVKLCGAFKHQWRDGKHGWQDATVEEVFPSNHVWHAPEPKGPPMRNALRRFYGMVPAVVEICAQAGADVPRAYFPMMRLDVVLPDSEEARFVA